MNFYKLIKNRKTTLVKINGENLVVAEACYNEREKKIDFSKMYLKNIDEQNIISQSLKEIFDSDQTLSRKIVTSVSGELVYSKILNLKKISKKNLRQQIEIEFYKEFPELNGEVYLDYQVLNKKNNTILVAVIKKNILEKYVKIFKEANLELIHVDSDNFAIFNNFSFSHFISNIETTIIFYFSSKKIIAISCDGEDRISFSEIELTEKKNVDDEGYLKKITQFITEINKQNKAKQVFFWGEENALMDEIIKNVSFCVSKVNLGVEEEREGKIWEIVPILKGMAIRFFV